MFCWISLRTLSIGRQDPGCRSIRLRFLDLDIIFYDEIVMNHPRLVIPHPRMHKRRFVLKPVCDIDPHINHPVFHRTMQSLLEDLDETGQRIAEYK